MRKEDAISALNTLENSLKQLKSSLSGIKSKYVARKEDQQIVRQVATKWFEDVEGLLIRFSISDDTKKKYHDLFSKLLSLSLTQSWKHTYLRTINDLLLDYKSDLLIPVLKSAGQIVAIGHLTKILENVTDEEEEYLNEALGCAGSGFFRASIVLAWSAAVHRMHKVIEKLGFDEFNKKTKEMKNIKEGRFKRFNKSFNVSSLSELRATVFDNDLLWVLEYWGLIDSNQHERLSICFTMRNNAAHPGEAPITEENLASFYSDLKKIVFDNPKFKL